MFLQTSWCLSWFHISGVHAYHQDKCSRQGTTGIFLHKARSTISFPVSDHIVIEKLWYRTKRALSEPQHWSTWLYTTLYTRACPALSHVSVKFISVMNFRSQGLSNTINTIRKNTITTSWSRNSHYRKRHWNITTPKSLSWDPTDTCQASVGGKNLLSCVGYAPRGNFTHTHTHTHPPPEGSPVLWGTTPADSIKAKVLMLNPSLAKEFCTWPTSRLLHHSSQLRTASCHHCFLLHMLVHGLASLTHMKLTPCYPSISYMSTSFPIKLCSLLWALPCSPKSILNTGWLCPDELHPAVNGPCSWGRGNRGSTSLLKRWAHH